MKKKLHTYQTRQQMLSGNYEIFHYSDSKIRQVNLHHHDFYECYFFISGSISYLIEGKNFDLKPGDIVLVNFTELHQAVIKGSETPCERIVLWLNKDYLNSLSTSKTDLSRCFEDTGRDNIIRAGLEMQQSIRATLDKLLSVQDYTGIGCDLLEKTLITELLVYLNIIWFENELKFDVDVRKNNIIDGIIHYINSHIEDQITIDELSEHFFLSKYHLLREFKKHTGTTIHKYIVQKKLIQAKKLILCGTPIINVYKQCGFGDYSNFFRAFKNEYGVTPKYFYDSMYKNGS
ncbi:MAG TPA: AraC family transcriptional regulator [Ruminiclostridium sp.]|nr:AraC family transcriptional regulator [Ruminiclostridium sp.]